MKRFWHILLTAGLCLSLAAGCGAGTAAPSSTAPAEFSAAQAMQNSASQTPAEPQQAQKLTVYTSIYPMYDFATKIAGEKMTVVNMVPAGTEPHDWEPAPADIAALGGAAVFVYSGAGMEHWTEDVLKSLKSDTLIVVEAAKGLTLIDGHDGHDGEAGHEEDTYDPHVWLNPLNAKAQMEQIKNAFAEADPPNKDYYGQNYAKYAAECDRLDAEYREAISSSPNRTIIVSHEAFGYLCAAYGLTQIGIEGFSPDSEPDPARMVEIIDFARQNGVKTIFFEEMVSPRVAQTIADSIGAKTAVLSPIEGIAEDRREAGEDYFSVMRRNLAALKEALQ